MIQRDRLAGLTEVRLTRRNAVRALAIGMLGLTVAPALAQAAGAAPSESDSTAAEAQARSHVVQRGDTVRKIAATYGTTEDALVKLNPALAANPHLIFPGQVLKIPATVEPTSVWNLNLVTPDETLPRPESTSRGSATASGDYPIPAGLPAYQAEFLKASIGPAIDSMRATGVPASVTLAQAILESDWGRSSLATDGRNYFGIKATSKQGTAGSITLPTREAGIGTVIAGFRAYNSMLESFVDHGNFLVENSRYAPALAVKDDARAFARAIQQAGYATDPNYATALINLMIKFGLEQYDQLK
jgi:flagellum-specific peptidoglycan hydrolase FlgJ